MFHSLHAQHQLLHVIMKGSGDAIEGGFENQVLLHVELLEPGLPDEAEETLERREILRARLAQNRTTEDRTELPEVSRRSPAPPRALVVVDKRQHLGRQITQ